MGIVTRKTKSSNMKRMEKSGDMNRGGVERMSLPK
jgi:hypothetical protein